LTDLALVVNQGNHYFFCGENLISVAKFRRLTIGEFPVGIVVTYLIAKTWGTSIFSARRFFLLLGMVGKGKGKDK
jgi:hypothetical protein